MTSLSTKKRVIQCEEGLTIPKNCVTSFMDDPILCLILPNAVGLFHRQESSHPVGGVDQVVLGGDGERGQVLQDVGRAHLT